MWVLVAYVPHNPTNPELIISTLKPKTNDVRTWSNSLVLIGTVKELIPKDNPNIVGYRYLIQIQTIKNKMSLGINQFETSGYLNVA